MFDTQEKIERYLNNNMSESEKKSFEKNIENCQSLANLVQLEKNLIDYFRSPNLKLEQELNRLGNKYFLEREL